MSSIPNSLDLISIIFDPNTKLNFGLRQEWYHLVNTQRVLTNFTWIVNMHEKCIIFNAKMHDIFRHVIVDWLANEKRTVKLTSPYRVTSLTEEIRQIFLAECYHTIKHVRGNIGKGIFRDWELDSKLDNLTDNPYYPLIKDRIYLREIMSRAIVLDWECYVIAAICKEIFASQFYGHEIPQIKIINSYIPAFKARDKLTLEECERILA